MRSTGTLATCLWLWAATASAQDFDPELMQQFNELSARAEAALHDKGADAAIHIYEEGLLGPLGEFGYISLRLGQLYEDQGRHVDAAHHFQMCLNDAQVDKSDRDMICAPGLEGATAPLTIEGLPEGGRVVLIEPPLFAGQLSSGDRVPKSQLRLVVEAPGRENRESTVEVKGPTIWRAQVGMPLNADRVRPSIPDDFLGGYVEPDASQAGRPIGRWPAYLIAGVGAGMIGGGLFLGFDSQSTVDDARARQIEGTCGPGRCGGDLDDARSQARLADGLWMSGAALVVTGAVLWWILGDDAPPPAPAGTP